MEEKDVGIIEIGEEFLVCVIVLYRVWLCLDFFLLGIIYIFTLEFVIVVYFLDSSSVIEGVKKMNLLVCFLFFKDMLSFYV